MSPRIYTLGYTLQNVYFNNNKHLMIVTWENMSKVDKPLVDKDTILPKTDVDVLDVEILAIISKGHTSSYSIWSFMKDEAIRTGDQTKFMAYKNVNQRVLKLWNSGLISKINNEVNVHGRKDFKLNDDSLAYLVPYILTHPNDVKGLIEYVDQFKLDKYFLGELLLEGYVTAFEVINEYHKYSNALFRDTPSGKPSWAERRSLTYNRIEVAREKFEINVYKVMAEHQSEIIDNYKKVIKELKKEKSKKDSDEKDKNKPA